MDIICDGKMAKSPKVLVLRINDGELTKRGFQGKIVIILPLFFHRGLYDRCGLEDSNFKK